jgi:lipopolysaccharide/colanic/teichoic acid biosynthesis glycosyltransferase
MIVKRIFDCILSLLALFFLSWLLFLCIVFASLDSKSFGIFTQKRIGQFGKPFRIYKIKTLHGQTKEISGFGKFLRKSKLDELPQLINILNGTMSFVGPRPDIAGYADKLMGDDCVILIVRPGVTGLASLKYRNEEYSLANQSNPLAYNDTIIWPDKIRINKWYVQNRTFAMDIKIIIHTLYPSNFDVDHYIDSQSKKILRAES